MELIEVGKLTIEPFELERILEVRMEKKRNEHASLFLQGVIQEGAADSIMAQVTEHTCLILKQGERVLFHGVLQKVLVTCENRVYYLEATGISHSIQLDGKPKKRSFQEKGMGYEEILEQVVQETDVKLTYHAPIKKVESLLLQYQETDWEFLKRLASHSHSVLIPKTDQETPEVLFGVPEGVEYRDKLEVLNYSVQKEMTFLRSFSQREEVVFQEEDAIRYQMKTDAFVFDLGDMLQFNQKELYVDEASLHLLDSVLTCTYFLSTKTALSVPRIQNPALPGLSLAGTVLKVEQDKVKVQLSIDEEQKEEKAYPFPYATGYSAEGNTGWYGMPEPGDTVQVFFPTEEEGDGYSSQSIRQKESEKMTDPRIKYLRTPDGKEIQLAPEEILITGKDGVTYVSIHEGRGIEIRTDQQIRVVSEGSLEVSSGDAIHMYSGQDFTVSSGGSLQLYAADSLTMNCRESAIQLETGATGMELKAKKPIRVVGGDKVEISSQGELTATTKGELQMGADKKVGIRSKEAMELTCKTNQIQLEVGKAGVCVTSGKPIQVTGKNTVSISSKKDLTATSSKNLKLASKQKMTLSGEQKLEVTSDDSSMVLDGEINLKARMIKEN